ncbi:MAG: leucyl-tRNA synthetase, partial [Sphingobacteriales bacterium]
EWNDFSEKQQQDIISNFRLAYQSFSEVNYCPALGTVLANDEVKDGKSERGGHPVERIKMRQWFLRITAYAERLLGELDNLQWSDSLKEMQRNWIGKSEGADIDFRIENTEKDITVFTTRPDTIFGATFMVLAPEHEWVAEITTSAQTKEIEDYIAYCKARTDVERQQEKKVTGAFTGTYAINPISGDKLPIYISEYVLAGYGTGAIMAVPSDDDRDNAFADKFGISIIEVIDKSDYPGATRDDKIGKMINSDFLNGLEVKDAITKALDHIESNKLGARKINYKLRDAGFSRQRYWGEPFPIKHKDGISKTLTFENLPLELPMVNSYKPQGHGQSPLSGNEDWVNLPDGWQRETDTMPGYAGSSWYFLRYMDPKNPDRFVGEEAEKYWQDVDLYIGGAEHAVGHLMYSRFWQKYLFDQGLVTKDEPFKQLINQGMILGRSNFVYRIKDTNKFVTLSQKDNYDTTPLHVDVNIVNNDILDIEAFKKSREDYASAEFILESSDATYPGKYVCGNEVEKMSKSKFNVVSPDDIIANYGADTLRIYEMFLGPLEQHKPWNTNGIDGVFKFLKKFWRLFIDKDSNFNASAEAPTKEELKVLHKTLKKIEEDVSRFSFNTIVSAMMIAINELTDHKCNKKAVLEPLVVIFSPYAPHLCEELWEKLGNKAGTITSAPLPKFDKKHLVEDAYEYPVSINGKMRVKIKLPLDYTQQDAEKEVLNNEVVMKWLDGKPPRKVIFVPGKIMNIVV